MLSRELTLDVAPEGTAVVAAKTSSRVSGTASARRVLIVSPHFPPDATAATHRVRLLAPYLPQFGWQPIVVTVDPQRYEGRLEPGLLDLVPDDLRVYRSNAWPAAWTRRFGFGDLGLRAFAPMLRMCTELIPRLRIEAIFITTYPIYTAAIGPFVKRRFRIPFIVDLQDPWVGAWGSVVGGGPAGAVDARSRVSRFAAAAIERSVIGAADAITAVSAKTIDEVVARVPAARGRPSAAIPVGGDRHDFEVAAAQHSSLPFTPGDGLVHLCAVGTLLPMGIAVLRAVFAALAQLRARRPDLFDRLRLHVVGTSNEGRADAAARVLPIAREAGLADIVFEQAERVDYLDAVRIQLAADALLLLGSSEPHYTASRLYPALLAKRPLLAVYHEASSVADILRRFSRPPTCRVVTFSEATSLSARTPQIEAAIAALLESPAYNASDVDASVFAEYSAPVLAGRLADVLSRVAAPIQEIRRR